MLIIIATIIFLLPKKIVRLVLLNKINNLNILEIIITTPLLAVVSLAAVRLQLSELFFFSFFLYIYLLAYILLRKKTINKLKYNIKLYNMKGFDKYRSKWNQLFYFFKLLLVFLFVFCTLFLNPIEIILLLVVISIAISIYLLKVKAKQVSLQEKYTNEVIEAINHYNPFFVFYFTASNQKYLNHITTWLPYLKKCDVNFFLMIRERKYLPKLLSIVDDIPIVVATKLSDIELFLPSSIQLAFYANNGTKNTHLVRFNYITHIQLLHGESEKPSSYNPIVKMYDKLFVSGQRAIDRYYENNIELNKENFVIVGRPQVSEINVVTKKVQNNSFTILIAPTWQGFYKDAEFSSLLKLYDLIELLLGRKEKIKLIVRLHPLTNRNELEIKEVLKKVSAKLSTHKEEHICYSERQISDDFNESDCIVTDISSVPIDYIYSNKPIIHIDVNNLSQEFKNNVKYEKYAKAVYVIYENLGNLDQVFDDVLYDDKLSEIRRKVKEYYHGKLNKEPQKVFCEEIYKLIDQKD